MVKFTKSQLNISKCIYSTLLILFILSCIIYFIINSTVDEINIGIYLGIFIFWLILTIVYFFIKNEKIIRIIYITWLILSCIIVGLMGNLLEPEVAKISFILTLCIFLFMTTIAFFMIKSGVNFNPLYYLFSLIFLIIVLALILIRIFGDTNSNNIITLIVIVVVSILIVLDTWFFIASKNLNKLTNKQRCREGVMNIWLDLINLFSYIGRAYS